MYYVLFGYFQDMSDELGITDLVEATDLIGPFESMTDASDFERQLERRKDHNWSEIVSPISPTSYS